MTHVVITGSSSGIGLGMAREFLKHGNTVTLNGRNKEKLEESLNMLQKEFPSDMVHAVPADITQENELQSLFRTAQEFLPIDIWINNAGADQKRQPLYELELSEFDRIIDLNLKAMMKASRLAIRYFIDRGHGSLFNMEGFGANGSMREQLGLYGTTKYALRYFTKSLAKECKQYPNITVGRLSPGMVTTSLLLHDLPADPKEKKQALKIFAILADTVETVTPFLVKKMLRNTKQAPLIAWLTGRKIFLRFFIAPFHKRDIIKVLEAETVNEQ